jgi:hypothetical protein
MDYMSYEKKYHTDWDYSSTQSTSQSTFSAFTIHLVNDQRLPVVKTAAERKLRNSRCRPAFVPLYSSQKANQQSPFFIDIDKRGNLIDPRVVRSVSIDPRDQLDLQEKIA